MPRKDNAPRRVLLSRFSALGDVAMTIPVVYSVCMANPECDFYYLTRRLPSQLMLEPPANLHVISIDTNAYKGVMGLRRLADELTARHGIDAYADLHNVLRTRLLGIWLRLKRIPVVHLRKGRRARRALTRRRNKIMMPITSMRARYREVFFRLSLAYSGTFRGFWAASPPAPALYATATPPRRPGETWIGIAPFARHRGKIYPPEMMQRVVALLAARPGYRLFLFGAGDQESNTLSRWALGSDNIINMAPLRLGLKAEMALMHQCDAMISMDSANMHLASLVGTRVVSVWGATHPFCGFLGWHQRKQDVVSLDMVCRPCSVFGNKPCRRGDFHCMYGLPVQLIISTLDRSDRQPFATTP